MVLCFLLTACASRQPHEDAKRLSVPGSGACEQVLIELAAAFNTRHPGLKVLVPRSVGTSGGIKAVGTGESVLGRVGRPLKDSELNRGLAFLPIAYDAVVFATGRSVAIDRLSGDRLAGIFRGDITSWRQIGGPPEPIRVLIRQADETSLENIRRDMPEFRDLVFSDQAKMAFHDYEMVALLNKFPSSIGFLTHSSLAVQQNHIGIIGIDGVLPTAEHLVSGAYPLKTTYGLIHKKGRLNPLAAQFIEFTFSEKGRHIIRSMGLIAAARSR